MAAIVRTLQLFFRCCIYSLHRDATASDDSNCVWIHWFCPVFAGSCSYICKSNTAKVARWIDHRDGRRSTAPILWQRIRIICILRRSSVSLPQVVQDSKLLYHCRTPLNSHNVRSLREEAAFPLTALARWLLMTAITTVSIWSRSPVTTMRRIRKYWCVNVFL